MCHTSPLTGLAAIHTTPSCTLTANTGCTTLRPAPHTHGSQGEQVGLGACHSPSTPSSSNDLTNTKPSSLPGCTCPAAPHKHGSRGKQVVL